MNKCINEMVFSRIKDSMTVSSWLDFGFMPSIGVQALFLFLAI